MKDAEQLAAVIALELAQLRDAMAGNLDQWSNAMKVTAARPLQLSRATVSPNLWNGAGNLVGWSLSVPAGAAGPGTVLLTDGDGGDVVGTITVPVGSSVTGAVPGGVSVGLALYAVVTGPVVGVVYFRD